MNPKTLRGPSSIESNELLHDQVMRKMSAAESDEMTFTQEQQTENAIRRSPVNPNEEFIQQKSKGGSGNTVSRRFESSVQNMKPGGKALDKKTNSFMSQQFGSPFDHVKIHNNSRAHQLSEEINARAFTVGNHIFFGKDQYQPESRSGKHLLAHELTHTVQQSAGLNRKKQGNISKVPRERISRWTKSGNTATVSKRGDTLAQLAHSITGNWKDWQCIWIDNMRNQKRSWSSKYHRYLEIGDTFDISNLNATSGVSATIVFTGADQYLQAVSTVYGGTGATSPFIEQLELLSNYGETPIQNLTLVGHSNRNQMWGDNASFTPSAHNAEFRVPDGFMANNKQGPKRCWFTRNARVRFVGCSSEHVAGAMASNLLRKGATATGTTHWICGWNQTAPVIQSYLSVEGPPCTWPPSATTYPTPAAFSMAPMLWVVHNGVK